MKWKFYGRKTELAQLEKILSRNRWFFIKITGRRRIGKTALIQQALAHAGARQGFYVQIPDSSPAGVLSAFADAMETFRIDSKEYPRPKNMLELAKSISAMARKGIVVTLDEFQYFNRERLTDFCSFLQSEVDTLSQEAERVPGGLIVLGSIHTEMTALLEDRSAPLYNRVTDEVDLQHLDVGSLLEMLRSHFQVTPEYFLFLWNLFEGVPKFYRDCYEQKALGVTREELLRIIFFESSSPLRTEADNWFLKELHGRYDALLKYVARHAGCSHADLVQHVRSGSPETEEQVGGYLKVLTQKYSIIEKKLPIFAKPTTRNGRYYLSDNFLRSWLGALTAPVSALHFSPQKGLVKQADVKLQELEGFGLEKLVADIYEERSRKGLGDFALSAKVEGYWDRSGTEIDLVAIDEKSKIIRFGSCKRAASKHMGEIALFQGHTARFLNDNRQYQDWTIQRVCISPNMPPQIRKSLLAKDLMVQDLNDLFSGL